MSNITEPLSWLDRELLGDVVEGPDGVALPRRASFYFPDVTPTDDPLNDRTVIPGGGSSIVPRRSSAVTTTLVSSLDYHLSMTVAGPIAKLPAAPSNGETFCVKAAFTTVGGTCVVEPVSGTATVEGAASFDLGPRESATLRFNADANDWEDC